MKITAKNYAKQACDGLRFHATKGFEQNPLISKDYENMLWLADVIEQSEHFVLPDGGKIFDDQLKGLADVEELRLPYEKITMSFFDPSEEIRVEDDSAVSFKGGFGKTFVSAREVPVSSLDKKGQDLFYASEKVIVFNMVAVHPQMKPAWTPVMYYLVIPTNWRCKAYPGNDKRGNLYSVPKVFLPGFEKEVFENVPDSERSEIQAQYIQPLYKAFSALAEMCEALTCANIEVIPVPKSKTQMALENKKKKKNSPLFVEKTLTILLPTKRTVRDDDGEEKEGKRKSPRWHLRRGHIRRNPNGTKIFIEAHPVGSKENGEVKKDYKVKAA